MLPSGAREPFSWDDDPLWYKDAIIYELHVRAFQDSDGDGIGDFRGLTDKLDYLQELGVTAIWLLPFYPSPLKDDGYDISDYTAVHPDYGTLQDFRTFLREASERGLRVITELVLNHTSDKHPWFQRSRRGTPGSRWRNFYVWSDTPDKYRDARIIFTDFESSNWALDPVARAYYWHRFYSHQPDLNYNSPLVRRAMLRAVDFWLGMGVSGLRLDAVPYLYEREGTNCENLLETHTFLKELRSHIDKKFQNRMLLAEANQWPEDAVAYFGGGAEHHMAFHFPIMPRMFMGIRMEDRFPIVDIFQQTPSIPEACQWALFLRNHDELTLEMVTDEERDYMYRVYASDHHARLNLGIRRRLAPLLNNDRRKIELMNALLFSLPGTPVVYYGDEIGMGDNFYLGDRNGVRTPMQWSADRNAGFSRGNPQKLYLPVIIDPEYHYEAVNVEAQEDNPASLLWWMKRLIALRKGFKAFGRGSLEFLSPVNPRVLAFVRRHQDETVLVVANLSRLAQHVSLNLSEFAGKVPVELMGRTQFPPVEEDEYFFTLSPYAFHWFSLEPPRIAQTGPRTEPSKAMVPTLTVSQEWQNLFKEEPIRAMLESVLVGYTRGRPWFGGTDRYIQSAEIRDAIPLFSSMAYLVLVAIEYSDGEPETYLLPLTFASGQMAERIRDESPQAVVATVKLTRKRVGVEGVLYDALVDRGFCNALLGAIARRRRFRGELGEVVASRTSVFRRVRGPAEATLEPALLKAQQSNTSVVYGDRLILKLYRRLDEGINPELDMGDFLTEQVNFPDTPPLAGALEYQAGRNQPPITVGVLHAYVEKQGSAWQYTLDSLGPYFERILAHPEVLAPPLPEEGLLSLAEEDLPLVARETVGSYIVSAGLLGQRTAELHAALASDLTDPDFAPEPFSAIYQRSLHHAMRSLAAQTMQQLRQRLGFLPEDVRQEAEKVLGLEGAIIQRFEPVRQRSLAGMRIRCHGDYQLEEVLYTGRDFVVIDFEGEPARPLSERRLKRSPLRDVASMLRSFHYAAHAALAGQAPMVLRPEDVPLLEPWARLWQRWVSLAFWNRYRAAMAQTPLLPQDPEDIKVLLDAYIMEKAIYELGYELKNRPSWVEVPLQGILQLLEAEE